jgi:hypothetical protein
MDFILHDFSSRVRTALESRISELSTRTRTSRIPRGAWIAPIALLLAIWANQGSREEGRLDWLVSNPPTREVWQNLFARRGFEEIEDSAWREKAFLEMPEAGRKKEFLLVSEDRSTLALRTDGDWIYYSRLRAGRGGQTIKRALWEPLGLSWEAIVGFEALSLPEYRVSAEKTGYSTEWSDPRSLNY